ALVLAHSGGGYLGLVFHSSYVLLGENLGIQLGGGDTAVTPTDFQLEQRFPHGVRPTDGVNAIFEKYTAGDDGNDKAYGANWISQCFRAQRGHKLYSVKLKLYRTGLPGIVNVDIYGGFHYYETGTTNKLRLLGSALVSGTTDGDTLTDTSPGEWREITFPSQIEIIPGMMYVIQVTAPGGSVSNQVNWRYKASSTYTQGVAVEFTSDVDSYGEVSEHRTYMFEELGRSEGEIQYGGCELVDLAFVNPNGEFTIRRFFTNKSGQNRVVKEVG
ncbi:unnamed protein product, partial [marine sediment metagenome]